MLDVIALILTVIGGINWGLIGIFQFDSSYFCIALNFHMHFLTLVSHFPV